MPRGRRLSAPLANDAFARLFEGLHEGLYIGLVELDSTATLAANPRLRLIFGWAEDAPIADVRPFDPERFVDDQGRLAFLQQLARDGVAHDYLLRLRRIDGSATWIEVTARAEPVGASSTLRVEAVMRHHPRVRRAAGRPPARRADAS
jgi:PAS domain-containing protein